MTDVTTKKVQLLNQPQLQPLVFAMDRYLSLGTKKWLHISERPQTLDLSPVKSKSNFICMALYNNQSITGLVLCWNLEIKCSP